MKNPQPLSYAQSTQDEWRILVRRMRVAGLLWGIGALAWGITLLTHRPVSGWDWLWVASAATVGLLVVALLIDIWKALPQLGIGMLVLAGLGLALIVLQLLLNFGRSVEWAVSQERIAYAVLVQVESWSGTFAQQLMLVGLLVCGWCSWSICRPGSPSMFAMLLGLAAACLLVIYTSSRIGYAAYLMEPLALWQRVRLVQAVICTGGTLLFAWGLWSATRGGPLWLCRAGAGVIMLAMAGGIAVLYLTAERFAPTVSGWRLFRGVSGDVAVLLMTLSPLLPALTWPRRRDGG